MLCAVLEKSHQVKRALAVTRHNDGAIRRHLPDELVESAEHKAGLLTLWGQGDLDLPPSWGAGPLYDAGPPPPAA